MQNIKFNTSREVILLLLVAPIWLTTPAYANNKPGSQFDPTQTEQLARTVKSQRQVRRLCQKRSPKDLVRDMSLREYREIIAAENCVLKCEKDAGAKVLPINQRLQEEASRKPSNRAVINSLEKQRLEVFKEIKRCNPANAQ